MAIAFGTSGKFVLIIGDEGALLMRLAGTQVRDSCFAASTDPADSAQMADLLARSPTTPIHPLIDVLDQSYVKDTIPPVNLIDSARLVQRRLDTAFPNVAIKGACYLGRTSGGERQDKRYLLAGLPGSSALDTWVAWMNARHNPVKPLALLPLEAIGVAASLSRSCHLDGTLPQWVMLVARQRVGGFRQVVLRRGEFVFTRLTQSLPIDAPPADVAAAIEREYRLSMGYLRRMPYSAAQGMDVIVIAAQTEVEALIASGVAGDRLTVLSPWEAAERLQLDAVGELGDGYSDALIGAAFGRSRRPVLSLVPRALYEKRMGSFVTAAAYALIALVIGYLSFNLSDAYLESQEIERAYEQASLQAVQREARLDAVLDEAGDFQVSGPEVADTIALYDRLAAGAPSPLPLLALLGPAMNAEIVIQRIDWQTPERAGTNDISLALTIHIEPEVGDIGAAVAVAAAFAVRIADRFPGLDVRVTDPPIDILPDQYLSGEVDLTDDADDTTEIGYEAVVSIFVPATWPPEPSS